MITIFLDSIFHLKPHLSKTLVRPSLCCTLHTDTLILPAIILKIVSLQNLSLGASSDGLAAWSAKGALRGKSWKETSFKISAQRFNVYICNVLC